MDIKDFAKKHRLKLSTDECGDPVVTSRLDQSNIYEYSEGELGVMFMTDAAKAPRTNLWNKFKAACLAAGMILRQSGDAEGAFSFDPADAAQSKLAIKGIRAKVKRYVSPEQAAAGALRLAAARENNLKPQQEAINSR